MTRKFVLVTAAHVAGNAVKEAAGIRKLKRGCTLLEFVNEYLSQFENLASETVVLIRDGAYAVTSKNKEAKELVTWNFTLYEEDELLTAVGHLKREELLRDLKELLPLKAT
jgi:hypothetical protein